MNLHEIQDILKKDLKCPEKITKSIVNILEIVKHKSQRVKQEIVEIIERDSKK